jgi:hypothetical protein
MKTAFDDWLRELAAAGKGGSALSDADIPAAIRGEYWPMQIQLSGNWATATLEGSIRSAPDAASALATITIGSPTFDAAAGVTYWTASLASGTGSNSTGSLPADTDGSGEEKLPIAFYITPSGGTRSMLFGGVFTLLGKV